MSEKKAAQSNNNNNTALARVQNLLFQQKNQIQMALPKHMNPDRMLRIALTEMRTNPGLQECDPLSICGSIVQASQLGLEPGNSLGHVYLIPFYNSKRRCKECQLMVGYKGLMSLARRSGQITSISARIVHERDSFQYKFGLDESIEHVPCEDEDPGPLSHVYAVAKLKDGGIQFEIMNRAEIDKVKNSLKYKNPVWESHYEEMAKKTVIRRLSKYLPLSPEFYDLTRLEAQNHVGQSQDNHLLIDAKYEPKEQLSPDAVDLKSHYSQSNEKDSVLVSMMQEKVDHLRKQGVKDDSLKRHLNTDNLDFTTWPQNKLEASLEHLSAFEKLEE
jgi:recombination protein RecT